MQLWGTDTLGGFLYSLNLSDKLRMAVQPLTKFRQFADVKDASQQGLNKGDTFHWNVFSDVATQGGVLTETNTMPESEFTITQGTLTVTEYGNSVPYTGKLDDLSEQPVSEIINKVLKHDTKKALDTAASGQFDQAKLRVVPTAGTSTTAITLTTDGTATLTNNVNLGKEHVKIIIDTMKERDIPPYSTDDYACLALPTTLRPFKNDLEQIYQYSDPGYMQILKGEIGRYENCRFFEQTFVAAAGLGTATAAWSTSKSDWACFFGEDTVAEAISIPEEIRGKIPTDYGRSRGVAWYYLGGFGIVHTQADQSRIVLWDSAA
jgi:N4-gp56 family major capsid protein